MSDTRGGWSPVPAPPHTPDLTTVRRGRSGTWLVVVLVALVVVGGAVAFVVARGGTDQVLPTVVLPPPTPTVTPVARDTATAFQQALPDTVLAFAVSGQTDAVDLLDAGAVEAYDVVYTDGQVDAHLRAAQWPTPDSAATAFSTQLAEPAPASTAAPTTSRDAPVEVAGTPAGRVIIVDDGVVARAVWSNGATTFRLDGPSGVVETFYDAFGM
jgi:hypothetical protein